ncbi:MAG: tRNA dihydrouridine synthase DusB [Peptoniphilus sp.]|nr:tRNA dihydrouridine synthase DusB [Peptoniphilus sp.]
MMEKIKGAILSPLAGYTDVAFREICSQLNAYMTVTEMVSAKALYYEDKKTASLLEILPHEKRVAVQIFGDDPDIMAEVVRRYFNSSEFAYIDINMGCPAPKIVKNNCGSALLAQPDLAYEVMRSVVRASTKPVSVKIRKGIGKVSSMEVAKLAERAGVSLITVHGRMREQYYNGLSDWDYIRDVAQSVSIPVIGNGDIQSYEDVVSKMEYSGVAGVSIGRGAIGNPFVFDEIYKRSAGLDYSPPGDIDRIEMAIRQLELTCKYKGERLGILEMRKQFVGYFKGMKGAKELRNKINQSSDLEEIIGMIKDFEDFIIGS